MSTVRLAHNTELLNPATLRSAECGSSGGRFWLYCTHGSSSKLLNGSSRLIDSDRMCFDSHLTASPSRKNSRALRSKLLSELVTNFGKRVNLIKEHYFGFGRSENQKDPEIHLHKRTLSFETFNLKRSVGKAEVD